jgi:hypothetical protein
MGRPLVQTCASTAKVEPAVPGLAGLLLASRRNPRSGNSIIPEARFLEKLTSSVELL